MDSYEHNTCSFIVKVWVEETDANTEQKTWRGHITHVYSGNRRYIEDLATVTTFIDEYLTKMQMTNGGMNLGSSSL